MEALTKPLTLARIDRLISRQRTNIDVFRRYHTLCDPTFEQVANQVTALKEAKPFIQASSDDTFRFRTAQLVYRTYTYLLSGSVENAYVTDHGLFAVGPEVSLSFNSNTRKPLAN